jgi:hypothetical protein
MRRARLVCEPTLGERFEVLEVLAHRRLRPQLRLVRAFEMLTITPGARRAAPRRWSVQPGRMEGGAGRSTSSQQRHADRKSHSKPLNILGLLAHHRNDMSRN